MDGTLHILSISHYSCRNGLFPFHLPGRFMDSECIMGCLIDRFGSSHWCIAGKQTLDVYVRGDKIGSNMHGHRSHGFTGRTLSLVAHYVWHLSDRITLMGISHLQKITSTFCISLCLLVTACGNSTKIEGFDSQAWQSDVAGCDGVRRIILENVDLETELIGLSESEILGILGKPDRNQLYKRSSTPMR